MNNQQVVVARPQWSTSMLITLWTGRKPSKPSKRTFEMITLHFMGWATDEELERHIEKLKIND